MDKNNTRVRFAPSPTGYLHVGSARTALFNWLFAKNTGGKMILRIEDTDISRHQEETIELILGSLKWLGINWDEGPDIGGKFAPYRQSQRIDIYREYAEKLIKEGKAYYCFCSPEKLAEKRKNAIAEKKYYEYDRECLKLADNEIRENIATCKEYTIRLSVPGNKIISFDDTVYGSIKVESKIIEDFIILRSNGLPTYNFSVAIDDILMKITDVIRGEDHLSNTPKQLLVYDALRVKSPVFTHLPMILGQDGQKLSKRHGSISIEAYREEGFLPEAILNYLALLGWAYDEKTTIFSKDELINKFSLDAINKKAAKFDYEKLLWLNGTYIRNTGNNILEGLVKERLGKIIRGNPEEMIVDEYKGGWVAVKKNVDNKIRMIVPIIKERLKTLKDSEKLISPFFLKLDYSEEIKKSFKSEEEFIKPIIDSMIAEFLLATPFDAVSIEKILRFLAEKFKINLRKIAEIIRLAVWASKISPPLFNAIEILGKNETIKRLEDYRNL